MSLIVHFTGELEVTGWMWVDNNMAGGPGQMDLLAGWLDQLLSWNGWLV